MIKRESDFQGLFSKWMEQNGFTCAYELKISHGNTVAFSKFESQQLPSLLKVNQAIKNHKLSDASLGLKPFDGFCLKNEPAYVGIMFNIPDNQNVFYLIHIKEVMKLREKQKSITKKDCESLGTKYLFNVSKK